MNSFLEQTNSRNERGHNQNFKKRNYNYSGIKSLVKTGLSMCSLSLALLTSALAENYKSFFRVVSSAPTRVMSLGLDDKLTWSNSVPDLDCRIQRARRLDGTNSWADYMIVRASNTINSVSLGGLIPKDMVYIPGGSFLMGDINNDDQTLPDKTSYEKPVHSVIVSPFYMDKYEVTNEKMRQVLQWAFDKRKIEVMTDNSPSGNGLVGVYSMEYTGSLYAPLKLLEINNYDEPESTQVNVSHISFDRGNSQFLIKEGKEDNPCVSITWPGAMIYCNLLTEMKGIGTPCYDINTFEFKSGASGFSLPTEAEWEFAALAGTTNRYACGQTIDYSKANYQGHYLTQLERIKTLTIGSFSPNNFGLYDMTGNAEEWCQGKREVYSTAWQLDPEGNSTNTLGVLRGGSGKKTSYYCRISYRDGLLQDLTRSDIGFRTVLR